MNDCWVVTQDTGVAPRSITVRFKHYKLAYCIAYTKHGIALFGPATLYYNNRIVSILNSFDEIREKLQKRGLPLKGIPHITP
jgi:predicted transcriptional regulator